MMRFVSALSSQTSRSETLDWPAQTKETQRVPTLGLSYKYELYASSLTMGRVMKFA